ncbi:hypothetical protein F4553_003245 [Allocatelliglobosispora scoriae]|uniref:WD40 repeat domain-containing protein n=1 Tax=Allocatelliglobosispora scoriae TaxID=643052 RepID=A0A841BR72_9ACTN|nr:delta-60 repeat domain-containing protein [Allocatelliglobosispora scoriae]MBB5869866.1 hypothetical protein [Allocatelliglobosispora scoriae]
MTRRIMLAIALAATLVVGISPAGAAPALGRVVSENPVDWTPHILDGSVWAMTVVGDTVVVGGDFTTVSSSDGYTEFDRWFLMAFSLSTGAVTRFAPWIDGPVYALTPGPDGTVLVGGDFTEVEGVPARSLARLDVATGRVVPGFTASLRDGDVRALAAGGQWLYVGGRFDTIGGTPRAALARVDIRTGAVDRGFDAELDAPELDRVKVEDVAVSPDGKRMIAAGALMDAMGEYRPQLAMFDISAPTVKLADWYSYVYEPKCRKGFDTYLRAVDFSPDGSYFVAVSTGRMSKSGLLCDTAARFETYGSNPHRPTWVNYTGGDSLYAVAVTGSAVYVGGHQRWLDNPYGHESAGPGAVSRPGISAIDPKSGRALDWNPTRSRGQGLRAFAVTPRGLLVGSDTDRLATEYHGRVGLFPPA